MRPASQFVKRLTRDTAGNVLPMAAVGVVVGMMIVGAAVDIGRNYLAREQLQAACDAGVLAGRRTVTTRGWDTPSQNAADAYFSSNFNDTAQGTHGTVFDADSDDEGRTVTATATTVLDTLIMRVFGKDSFTVSVSCGSSMGIGNADVMLVLDTTGSMDTALSKSQTRIQALRAAVKNFYVTMSNATAGTTSRIRYGFVPYSSTVNVGRLLLDRDPKFLADKHSYQSRQPFFLDYSKQTKSTATTYSNPTSESVNASKTYSKSDCTSQLKPSETDYSNNGSSSSSTSTTSGFGTSSGTVKTTTTQPQRKITYQCVASGNKYVIQTTTWSRDKITTDTANVPYSNAPTSNSAFDHWEYKNMPDQDTSKFKTFASTNTYTGTNGAAVSSTWAGCIEERATKAASSFSYSSLTGISPAGALDIDIDSAPGADDSTKWAPMWTQIAYTRAGASISTFNTATSSTGSAVAQYCPKAAQGLKEMSKDSFNTYADSLTAIGGTYLDIGMIWGGRLLSPDGIFSTVVNDPPANGGEVARHVIFMTDGEMDTANYVQTAWGIEWFDRRVTGNGTTDDDARHTQRFLATCAAIKDKGIRVWVVAFTSALSTDLKNCASDNSSYVASNATELNTAFQEIAKQVGELRVIQ
jgi:Flp pilus assembly protein TadG